MENASFIMFGVINSIFYQGDILAFYAVLGLFLIPVARLNSKTILIIAIILMLQPIEWIKLIHGLLNPDIQLGDPKSWAYFGQTSEYIPGKSAIKSWLGNLTTGRKAVLLWSWEQGLYLQTISLFMFGMLSGRYCVFAQSKKSKLFDKNFII